MLITTHICIHTDLDITYVHIYIYIYLYAFIHIQKRRISVVVQKYMYQKGHKEVPLC